MARSFGGEGPPFPTADSITDRRGALFPLSQKKLNHGASQSAKLASQAHLVPAPLAPGEPYDFYSTEDGRVSYLITEKGAPGHPAILMQRAGGGEVKTSGCPYGDILFRSALASA